MAQSPRSCGQYLPSPQRANSGDFGSFLKRQLVNAKKSPFKYPRKKNTLTILLIGETGCGKTSFMSLLLNLLQGNGPYELKDKHFTDAQSGLDKSKSQTTEARLYYFTTPNGVKVEILDTPGLADTRGIDEDKKHKERIYQAIQELITVIDGIMIVANGRVERLTVATDYTLNVLATLFPRSIVDNIGFIFTNVGGGGGGLNFQLENLPLQLKDDNHWCLDNPLSLYRNYSALKAKGGFGRNQETRQKRALEASYKEAIETLDEWFEWLDERPVMPTASIVELYQKSSHIESRLFTTISSIDGLSKLKSQLQGILSDLEVAEKQKERLTNLESQENSQVWALIDTPAHNTICTFEDCHSNCHETCALVIGDTATIGGTCRAFKTFWIPNQWLPFWKNESVKCGVCGHKARAHRHYQSIHQRAVSETYQKITEELQAVSTERERLEGAKVHIEEEVEKIKQEIEQSKRDIPRLVDELNRLSLSPNYADYISSALDLLKMKKEQLVTSQDPSNEMGTIEEGIKAFEAQLELIMENVAGRFVETSGDPVES